ncbi:hypothetical protein JXA88_13130, partial [Candidatus Fermentibacteria bacterium]|nr:hypothetical protein [Candidatus Fermentibacteria bacterium]
LPCRGGALTPPVSGLKALLLCPCTPRRPPGPGLGVGIDIVVVIDELGIRAYARALHVLSDTSPALSKP